MFDFPFTEPSVYTALFALCSYLFIYIKGYNTFIQGRSVINTEHSFTPGIIFLFYILISIHCINGDFFHLMESVHQYNLDNPAENHQEPIYTFIAKLFNRNYLLFRLTVWGMAILGIRVIYQKLRINFSFGLWIFLVCYAILFAYARASAAMALYFCGLVLLINDNTSIVKRLFGIGIILISYEFHRSMLILILLTPLAFVPLKKTFFYISIAALPLIIMLVRSTFSNVLGDVSILDDEYLQRKMDSYSIRESDGTSLRTQLMDGIKYASVYIPFVVSAYYIVIKKTAMTLSKGQYRLFVYTFWLFIITTSVSYLDLEVNTFFYRMLYMALIPSTAIFVWLIQCRAISKALAMRIIYVAMASQLLNYFYMIYLNL